MCGQGLLQIRYSVFRLSHSSHDPWENLHVFFHVQYGFSSTVLATGSSILSRRVCRLRRLHWHSTNLWCSSTESKILWVLLAKKRICVRLLLSKYSYIGLLGLQTKGPSCKWSGASRSAAVESPLTSWKTEYHCLYIIIMPWYTHWSLVPFIHILTRSYHYLLFDFGVDS